MNLSEFRAWFEGFTENITSEPSAKQWARIKKRVSEIQAEPHITVEKHYPAYWPLHHYYSNLGMGIGIGTISGLGEQCSNTYNDAPVSLNYKALGLIEHQQL